MVSRSKCWYIFLNICLREPRIRTWITDKLESWFLHWTWRNICDDMNKLFAIANENTIRDISNIRRIICCYRKHWARDWSILNAPAGSTWNIFSATNSLPDNCVGRFERGTLYLLYHWYWNVNHSNVKKDVMQFTENVEIITCILHVCNFLIKKKKKNEAFKVVQFVCQNQPYNITLTLWHFVDDANDTI